MLGNLFNFVGGILDRRQQKKQFDRNFALQEEAFRSGIQTRVKDAAAAGIHPLYALGASSSVSPTFTSGSTMASGLGSMGKFIDDLVGRKGKNRLEEAQIRKLDAEADRAEAEAEDVRSRRVRTIARENEGPRTVALDVWGKTAAPKALPPHTTMMMAPQLGFVPGRATPAELMEEQYGDLGGSLYGLWRGGVDALDLYRDWVRRGPGTKRVPAPKGWRWKKPRPGSARWNQ